MRNFTTREQKSRAKKESKANKEFLKTQRHNVEFESFLKSALEQKQNGTVPIADMNSFDEKYIFHEPGKEFGIEEFIREFTENGKANSKKIQKQLSQMVYLQLLDELNDKFEDVPPLYSKNKARWVKMMSKTKGIQELLAEFVDRVKQFFEREFKQNQEQMSLYMTSPRLNKDKIKPYGKPFVKNQHKWDDHLDITLQPTLPTLPSFGTEGHTVSSKLLEVSKSDESLHSSKPRNKRRGALIPSIHPKDENPYKLEEFQKIQEKVNQIDDMINFWENDEGEFSMQRENFEKEAQTIDMMVQRNHPGEKLERMLEQWDQQQMMTNDDIDQFGGQLWLTAQQFEKELQQDIKGHQIELQRKSYYYYKFEEWIKHKTSMKIDIYETALIQLKLKQNQELAQANMVLEDYESRVFNASISEPELTKLLNYKPEQFKDINQIKKAFKSLQEQATGLQQKVKEQQGDVTQAKFLYEEMKRDLNKMQKRWDDLSHYRDFYRDLVVRVFKASRLATEGPQMNKWSKFVDKGRDYDIIDYMDSNELTQKFIGLSDWLNWLRNCMTQMKDFADSFQMIPLRELKNQDDAGNPIQISINDKHRRMMYDIFKNPKTQEIMEIKVEKVDLTYQSPNLKKSSAKKRQAVIPLGSSQKKTSTLTAQRTPQKRNTTSSDRLITLTKKNNLKINQPLTKRMKENQEKKGTQPNNQVQLASLNSTSTDYFADYAIEEKYKNKILNSADVPLSRKEIESVSNTLASDLDLTYEQKQDLKQSSGVDMVVQKFNDLVRSQTINSRVGTSKSGKRDPGQGEKDTQLENRVSTNLQRGVDSKFSDLVDPIKENSKEDDGVSSKDGKTPIAGSKLDLIKEEKISSFNNSSLSHKPHPIPINEDDSDDDSIVLSDLVQFETKSTGEITNILIRNQLARVVYADSEQQKKATQKLQDTMKSVIFLNKIIKDSGFKLFTTPNAVKREDLHDKGCECNFSNVNLLSILKDKIGLMINDNIQLIQLNQIADVDNLMSYKANNIVDANGQMLSVLQITQLLFNFCAQKVQLEKEKQEQRNQEGGEINLINCLMAQSKDFEQKFLSEAQIELASAGGSTISLNLFSKKYSKDTALSSQFGQNVSVTIPVANHSHQISIKRGKDQGTQPISFSKNNEVQTEASQMRSYIAGLLRDETSKTIIALQRYVEEARRQMQNVEEFKQVQISAMEQERQKFIQERELFLKYQAEVALKVQQNSRNQEGVMSKMTTERKESIKKANEAFEMAAAELKSVSITLNNEAIPDRISHKQPGVFTPSQGLAKAEFRSYVKTAYQNLRKQTGSVVQSGYKALEIDGTKGDTFSQQRNRRVNNRTLDGPYKSSTADGSVSPRIRYVADPDIIIPQTTSTKQNGNKKQVALEKLQMMSTLPAIEKNTPKIQRLQELEKFQFQMYQNQSQMGKASNQVLSKNRQSIGITSGFQTDLSTSMDYPPTSQQNSATKPLTQNLPSRSRQKAKGQHKGGVSSSMQQKYVSAKSQRDDQIHIREEQNQSHNQTDKETNEISSSRNSSFIPRSLIGQAFRNVVPPSKKHSLIGPRQLQKASLQQNSFSIGLPSKLLSQQDPKQSIKNQNTSRTNATFSGIDSSRTHGGDTQNLGQASINSGFKLPAQLNDSTEIQDSINRGCLSVSDTFDTPQDSQIK